MQSSQCVFIYGYSIDTGCSCNNGQELKLAKI